MNCPCCQSPMRLVMERIVRPPEKPRLRMRPVGNGRVDEWSHGRGRYLSPWRHSVDPPCYEPRPSRNHSRARPWRWRGFHRPAGEIVGWRPADPKDERNWVCPNDSRDDHTTFYEERDRKEHDEDRIRAMPFFVARKRGLLAKQRGMT